jgi:hypothetical protein
MRRTYFHEFIQVRNLREGNWEDDKLRSIICDLVVGPFTMKGVNLTADHKSLHLNQRRTTLKANYVSVIKRKINDAVKELRNAKQTESSE